MRAPSNAPLPAPPSSPLYSVTLLMCFPEQGFLSPQSIPPSIQTPNPAWSRAQREGPWSLAVLGRAGEGGAAAPEAELGPACPLL